MAEDTSWDDIGTGDGGPYSDASSMWDIGDNNFVNDLFNNDYNDWSSNIGGQSYNPNYSPGISIEGLGQTYASMPQMDPSTMSTVGLNPVGTGYNMDEEQQRDKRNIWDRIVNSATSPEGLGKLGSGLASLFTRNKLAGQLRDNSNYMANRVDPIGAALRAQAQGQASAILNDGGASNPMVQAAMRQAQEALLRTNSRNRYAASPMIADQLAAKQFELGQTQLNNLTRLLSNNADYRAVGTGLDKAAEAEANKYNGLATAIGDITRGSSGSDAKTIADTIIASLKGVK